MTFHLPGGLRHLGTHEWRVWYSSGGGDPEFKLRDLNSVTQSEKENERVLICFKMNLWCNWISSSKHLASLFCVFLFPLSYYYFSVWVTVTKWSVSITSIVSWVLSLRLMKWLSYSVAWVWKRNRWIPTRFPHLVVLCVSFHCVLQFTCSRILR